MALHLGLGEVTHQRFQLLLQRRFLRKDSLGCNLGAEGTEVGIVCDVKEALASLSRSDNGQSSLLSEIDGPYPAQLPLLVLRNPSLVARSQFDVIFRGILWHLRHAIGEEDDAIRLALLDEAGAGRGQQQREDGGRG